MAPLYLYAVLVVGPLPPRPQLSRVLKQHYNQMLIQRISELLAQEHPPPWPQGLLELAKQQEKQIRVSSQNRGAVDARKEYRAQGTAAQDALVFGTGEKGFVPR